jgi:transcriptional regulator GlxA family with amidase domain
MPARRPRRVVLLAFPGAQILDITGPSEAFALAERISPRSYSIELVTSSGGELPTSGGLRLLADRSLADCRGPIHTLLVAGGAGVRDALADESLLRWLAGAAKRARRVASVCTGAFLLAEIGLLDGRRASTHWLAADALARRHPRVEVDPSPIFIGDGKVFTSAGITAGIDLALALIEDDLGHGVSLEVARMLVLFVRRPGGQAQFSVSLAGQAAERRSLRELQVWIGEHLDADLRVDELAQRVFMSPRNFARVFAEQVGVTPARYVESLRVERARSLLEDGETSIEEVARVCGFRSVEILRRSFARRLGVAPAAYRSRFRRAAQPDASARTDGHDRGPRRKRPGQSSRGASHATTRRHT